MKASSMVLWAVSFQHEQFNSTGLYLKEEKLKGKEYEGTRERKLKETMTKIRNG